MDETQPKKDSESIVYRRSFEVISETVVTLKKEIAFKCSQVAKHWNLPQL